MPPVPDKFWYDARFSVSDLSCAQIPLDPIAHQPPLKPIDIAPRAPVTPAPVLEYWERDLERVAERARLERAERVWEAVVASAEATNMSVRPPQPAIGIPMAESEPSGAVEACVDANELLRIWEISWEPNQALVDLLKRPAPWESREEAQERWPASEPAPAFVYALASGVAGGSE